MIPDEKWEMLAELLTIKVASKRDDHYIKITYVVSGLSFAKYYGQWYAMDEDITKERAIQELWPQLNETDRTLFAAYLLGSNNDAK